MSKDIFNNVDFSKALNAVVAEGAVLLPNIIQPKFLAPLVDELNQGPFEQAEEGNELVRQRFDRFAYLHKPVGMPHLERLQVATTQLIRSGSELFPQLKDWEAVDTVVQRYDYNGFLTAHRDLIRHPYVIASFTVSGRCRFDVLESRSGPITKTMYPEAGSLILLRAPGLSNENPENERPFHKLTGALDENIFRIAVSFRHNLNPEANISGFSYCNQQPK